MKSIQTKQPTGLRWNCWRETTQTCTKHFLQDILFKSLPKSTFFPLAWEVFTISSTLRRTLKEISDVIVNPCVMTGSSSAVRPFHTSSSTQRQPASRTCLYISTEELPASWPAETRGREQMIQNTATGLNTKLLPGRMSVQALSHWGHHGGLGAWKEGSLPQI